MRLNETVIKAALAYVKAGFSVIPIKADGSKRPSGPWRVWQSRRASAYMVRQMFRGDFGIAVLGGKVSGGLEIFDFDRAEYIDLWIAKVEAMSPGLIARLPRIRTPKGGAHFYFRCSEIEGNQKLAQEPPSIGEDGQPKPITLIETRGEGGYVLAPPSPGSCHPLGIPYEQVGGPPILETPTITPEERRLLIDSATSFNLWTPKIVDNSGVGTIAPGDKTRPGDDFNARGIWREILEPAGWKVDHQTSTEIHWCRPGKKSGVSATTGHCGDGLYVFSSNANPFEPNQVYTKFAAYCLLNHNGDYTAAAKDLQSKGYGNSEKAEAEVLEFEKTTSAPKTIASIAFTPQTDYKKKKKAHASEFFDGRKFLPNVLAERVCRDKHVVATPIGDKYKGVYLYIYKDGVYRSDRPGELETEIRETLDVEATPKHIDDTIDMILRRKKIPYDRLNHAARDFINLKNGMLNWRTGELLPHDEKYLSTIQLNAEYKPDVTCPELDKFFEDIFPPDCILVAEEFMGYLMVPDTSFHKAFIAVGSGGNGKGTFLKVINLLLGDENISTVDLHTLETDKFSRALTLGKLANIHHDISREDLESTSVFKTMVSGDPITMEEKHKQGFSARPYARLVFSANEFPKSKDRTNAFFRRLIFVEFPKVFFESKDEVLEYEKKLSSVPNFMSALLNRAVTGLSRLYQNKKFTVLASSKAIEELYRREVDSAYDFFKECCVLEQWGWLPRRELYQKYQGWCQDEGVRPANSRSFVGSLRKLNGVVEVKREGVRGWSGVSWVNGEPPQTSQSEVEEFGVEGKQGDLNF